ncbi:helix-turn-helix transcriptional regulator [Budvicia aquatica]|uniref:helix-turn-helix transcriptional regulator n=1 Tax=Budvicia aquatica TaxID=82979 RepID=UPI0021014F0C|nr:WYL domain-containing protein [Budvicia aquatica]
MIMALCEQNLVTRSQLTVHFRVAERTIFRDLKKLQEMGLIQHKEGEVYTRTPATNLIMQTGILNTFADFTDVSKLLPLNQADFWKKMPVRVEQKRVTILGPESEHSVQVDLRKHFAQLENAIVNHRCCRIYYKDKTRRINPCRLSCLQGVWYLAATESHKLKTFTLSRIDWLDVLRDTFIPDATIENLLARQNTPWWSAEQTMVTLSVASAAAPYFCRRNLLPEQQIVLTHDDGSLTLTSTIAHQNQLFPIIRYWLPHLRIIEPVTWQRVLEEEIKNVLVL